ncbi:hypothetical protein WN944_011686 [Citrus x changshan-huyou]|uniref:Uncharacterized protein n=1 Tax=Citrus x changshan-huyou TaxID=2935761 RepID=A0AAP0R1N3_9ROSI
MGIHQRTIARYAVIVLSGNMTFVLREEGERGFASNSFQKYKSRGVSNNFPAQPTRDGNGLDLIQDPRDPNPIGSDLDRFKMDLDQIWILMCGSKTDLEQIWIYLNI